MMKQDGFLFCIFLYKGQFLNFFGQVLKFFYFLFWFCMLCLQKQGLGLVLRIIILVCFLVFRKNCYGSLCFLVCFFLWILVSLIFFLVMVCVLWLCFIQFGGVDWVLLGCVWVCILVVVGIMFMLIFWVFLVFYYWF